MLINLTNHSSSKWSVAQQEEASRLYGEVVDVEFPNISPSIDYEAVHSIAGRVLKEILECYGKGVTIHVMGEMTFVYDFVSMARDEGIECVASTTERIVVENADGTKTSTFNFVRYRSYGN